LAQILIRRNKASGLKKTLRRTQVYVIIDLPSRVRSYSERKHRWGREAVFGLCEQQTLRRRRQRVNETIFNKQPGQKSRQFKSRSPKSPGKLSRSSWSSILREEKGAH